MRHADLRLFMQEVLNSSESDLLPNIECAKKGFRKCDFVLFEIDYFLSKSNYLSEKFDRLKDDINSIKFDSSSLESKVKFLEDDIKSIKCDIKDIERFLLFRIRYSMKHADMCCVNSLSESKLWQGDY